MEGRQATHPPTNSPLDSLKGLPDSTVMIVQMSSSAATTKSYHLHPMMRSMGSSSSLTAATCQPHACGPPVAQADQQVVVEVS